MYILHFCNEPSGAKWTDVVVLFPLFCALTIEINYLFSKAWSFHLANNAIISVIVPNVYFSINNVWPDSQIRSDFVFRTMGKNNLLAKLQRNPLIFNRNSE